MPGPTYYNVIFKNCYNFFVLNDENPYFYDIYINNITINNGITLFIYNRMIFN